MKINSNKLKSLILLSLVGSASTNEEKSTNQTELTLNSLPQITTNFTKRGNETDPTFVFAGYPLFLGHGGASCSGSFAIVWPDEKAARGCSWGELSGFITSANCCNRGYGGEDNCCSSNDCGGSKDVFLNSEDKIKLGYVQRTSWDYIRKGIGDNDASFDFVFVANSNPEKDNIKFIPYVVGENNDLVPITSYGPASVGERACVYAATAAGRMCGKIVSLNEVERYRGDIGKIITEVGSDQSDFGGPVYVESKSGDQTIAQLVGHINSYSYDSDKGFFIIYYTPVEKTLEILATEENCHYVPLVYNETNAQEYDQLIAQMEIPPKK